MTDNTDSVGWPWTWLFPIRYKPHYDIEVPENVDMDILPFIPVLIVIPLVVLIVTVIFSKIRKNSSIMDKIAFFYLTLSCIIHFSIELYWARHNDIVLTDDSFIARLWREFGKCDTRWWSEDEVIFSLELMAGYFCGPMALITVIGYILDKPWRYITQAICVTAEAYGLLITWIPAYFVGLIHVPTWNWKLYYGYFWLIQSPWLFMPIILCFHSCKWVMDLYKKANNKKKD